MDQIDDPQELEREIERANRLASVVGDQTTYQRLKQFVEELKQNLQGRLAARRSAIRARARELWEAGGCPPDRDLELVEGRRGIAERRDPLSRPKMCWAKQAARMLPASP